MTALSPGPASPRIQAANASVAPEVTITSDAEANAIAKLAKSTESGRGAIMFLTHSPCIDCAKQIYTAGINTVFFSKRYRNDAGIEFLKKCNIEVIEWNTGENTTSQM